MSITWGAWNSTTRLRTGIEVIQSPASVTSATTQVTYTVNCYLQTYYASNETSSSTDWWISGSSSASGNTDWNLGAMGTKLMGSSTHVVALSYGSTQSRSWTAKTHSYYAYPGVETTAYKAVTVPARPYSVPSAESGVSVARVSDTQQNVTWTRNATTGGPYDNQYVERWDNVSNAYKQLASLSGTATSYSDTSTVANQQYRYRVRARNSAGYSGYAYSGYITTSPGAPSSASAAKNASDITVTWTDNASFEDGFEVWHAANGVWDGAALATVGAGVTTYTHTAPNAAQTHTYKVRAKITANTLYSAYSADSNTVQLIAPPNAPTNLSPNGVVLDATKDVVVSWKHNPVDTTAQRKRENRWSSDNGVTWNQPGSFTTSSQSRTWAAGTFTNGTTVIWQTRTWGDATTGGSDGTGASPWSASATMVFSAAPVATVNFPDGVNPVTTATLTATWGYSDPEAKAQAEWKAVLYNASGQAIETKSATGADTSYTFATKLQDNTNYSFGIKVRDADGVWSAEAVQAFSVAYAKPPIPQAWPTWDDESGTVSVEMTIGAAGVGEIDADYLRLWRSEDGGVKWHLVADSVDPGSSITDQIPPLNTTVIYKVEAVSVTPSVSYSDPASVFTDSNRLKRVWLNTGPDFSVSVFLAPECHVKAKSHRTRELRQFAGRDYPVEFSSKARTKNVDVEGIIVRDTDDPALMTSSWNEIESAVLEYSAPACIRDLRGNRYFVSTNDPDWDGPHKQLQNVSFSADVVDYSETETEGI